MIEHNIFLKNGETFKYIENNTVCPICRKGLLVLNETYCPENYKTLEYEPSCGGFHQKEHILSKHIVFECNNCKSEIKIPQ